MIPEDPIERKQWEEERRKQFKRIAELIAGVDAPPWLPRLLEGWAATVMLNTAVLGSSPSRAERREKFQRLASFASEWADALRDPDLLAFLQAGPRGPFSFLDTVRTIIDEIYEKSDSVADSPEFATPDGRTRAGRGPALPPGIGSPLTYCAAVIAEVWAFFNGAPPAPRNRGAADAAYLFWQAAGGGEPHKWGSDQTGRWRYHFEQARKLPPEQTAEVHRHLRTAAEMHRRLNEPEAEPGEK